MLKNAFSEVSNNCLNHPNSGDNKRMMGIKKSLCTYPTADVDSTREFGDMAVSLSDGGELVTKSRTARPGSTRIPGSTSVDGEKTRFDDGEDTTSAEDELGNDFLLKLPSSNDRSTRPI